MRPRRSSFMATSSSAGRPSPWRVISFWRFSSLVATELSLRIMGMMRLVRSDSSSSRVTARRRRWFMRCWAVRRTAAAVRGSRTRLQSARLSSSSLRAVARLAGSRFMIVLLAMLSVVEIFMVRSKGMRPSATACMVSMACWMQKSFSRIRRRKAMRVSSIFLASAISCSRASRGISPICERYMRTGSSTRRAAVSVRSTSVTCSRLSPPSSVPPGLRPASRILTASISSII